VFRKNKKICDIHRKTAADLSTNLGNEAVVSSGSECDINKKEELNVLKLRLW
jgi:hypothetical protein